MSKDRRSPPAPAPLTAWLLNRPTDTYVLPQNGEDAPGFTNAWDRVQRDARLDTSCPQGCRRTFESALACIGFPSTLTAFLLGHNPQVAAKHYLAFAPGRLPGKTVEAVLGITRFTEETLEDIAETRRLRLVR